MVHRRRRRDRHGVDVGGGQQVAIVPEGRAHTQPLRGLGCLGGAGCGESDDVETLDPKNRDMGQSADAQTYDTDTNGAGAHVDRSFGQRMEVTST